MEVTNQKPLVLDRSDGCGFDRDGGRTKRIHFLAGCGRGTERADRESVYADYGCMRGIGCVCGTYFKGVERQKMKIRKIPANPSNYGGNRGKAEYIVIHYTANDGDTAAGNGAYFQNNIVSASAHFFVDEKEVVCSVAPTECAWSVGGKKYANAATTGGGKWYGKCTNANSISVEMCSRKRADGSFYFAEQTMELAAELVCELMETYGISQESVIRHFDVTGKGCPAPFLEDTAWNDWKERLQKMQTERYNKVTELPYGRSTIERLIDRGYLKGDENGNLDLSKDMLRVFMVLDQAGVL